MTKIILTDEQQVVVKFEARTAAGNVARVDDADHKPQWAVSNGDVAELIVAEDGLSATVVSKGFGETQVSVTADADLDAGETRDLVGVLDVQVVAAEAVTLLAVAGEPTLKTPGTPPAEPPPGGFPPAEVPGK
jgi:hypothetical protein